MDTYITVTGNLTADPTTRFTASGATVVGFRVASSARRFDRETKEFRDGEPMYISVSCWRNLGANVAATLRKGDSVVVHGRMTFRTYDDKDRIRRSVHEIDALAVGPDLTRCPADLRRPTRPGDDAVQTQPDGPAAAPITPQAVAQAPVREPIAAEVGSAA